MELMDNTSSITTTIPKLIEFPEHFVMNTQLYDKQTLKPIPMKFNLLDTNSPYMLLQTSIDKTGFVTSARGRMRVIQNNNEHNKQNIIQDKNDPNVFYTIRHCITQGYDRPRLWKMQYDSVAKKYNCINNFNVANADNADNDKGDIKILHETDEYFILSIYTNYSHDSQVSYLYCCISLLHKQFFTYTRLFATSWGNFLLYANNDVVYILTGSNLYTRQIVKINTSTKVFSVIWTETITCNESMCCNPIKINDYFYVLTRHIDSSRTYSYKMMKISLDTVTDTVNTELLDINLNSYIMDSSSKSNMEYGDYIHYTLRVINVNSNIYVSCLIHASPNVPEWAEQHKHVLLKFNNTSFDVIDTILLTDGCYGSLENGDSKHQVWYMSNCVLFYSFDKTKEKMICTYRKGGAFMQIGFDSLNRFIVQYSDRSIEMLTNTNACILQADFTEELYDKDDSSKIDTTVSFYAKNFLDEYLETNVKLTLTGPVVFKENNEKTLVISTLKTGLRTVPVTITGYGNIEVIITQNT